MPNNSKLEPPSTLTGNGLEPTIEWDIPIKLHIGLKENILPGIKAQLKNIDFEMIEVSVTFSGLNFKDQNWNFKQADMLNNRSLLIDISEGMRTDSKELKVVFAEELHVEITVSADGQQIIAEKKLIQILPPIEISADVASVYSVVFQQNQFPLIAGINLTNHSSDAIDTVRVETEFDPPEFETATWNIDELNPGQTVNLLESKLRLCAGALDRLKEKRLIHLTFSVYSSKRLVSRLIKEVELLPKNHWSGEMNMPELLAAFVTPNTCYSDALLKQTANLLGRDGHESKLDGYQSNTRERPYMVAAALWSVICGEGISYCVPPASFAKSGQKIRLSTDISTSLLATCLDTALLFASCLEQAGLNSVIALTEGHALVGVWLVDECFPLVTNDDPVDLRNRIALKDLILFETTLVTSDQPIKFAQAICEADRKIAEEAQDQFIYVIDVKQARSRKISPIDFGGDNEPAQAQGTKKREVILPPTPVLPRVDSKEKKEEELTPAGRVEQWRRKLLDLSKRNKLLNIGQRSMGFRIICPDLDLLEDELASGKTFNIISKEELSADGRSSTQFTMQTGNDLEDEFVRDQLRRGSLIANCNRMELEKNLISLFRRAKSDLEEGGSNTLFLAIGMLRWTAGTHSEQSSKAPLILLPVKLERTSARAKPKIKKLPDEEPVFNLTLIEFLIQDFDIDLTIFQNNLPKDASGVDVRKIWKTVRLKIKDTAGFEVVEELVLSNFSFAKYLMWKDLTDRINDLKQSLFVNHLVERPADPYPFKADFIDQNEVDHKIDPVEFYAPLNADSSQIVAIDASVKGKDFVLEGPPGTGKSETIANIIAHNMALGKKVLFVSEKMAALDVVYTRLKNVGLGHLCLELHSSKASKRSVLDQLNAAWQVRESFSSDDWQERARHLGEMRNKLNRYVEELHRESHLGFSIFNTVARSVRYRDTARINLGWGPNLETAPCRNQEDVKRAMELSRSLGLSFKEIRGVNLESFALITVSEWSNQWQAKMVDAASHLKGELESFSLLLNDFLNEFTTPLLDNPTMESVLFWIDVARICRASVHFSHKYALAENAKENLGNLKTIAELKVSFKALVSESGVTVTPKEIKNLPVNEWKNYRNGLVSPGEIYSAGLDLLSKMGRSGFKTSFAEGQQLEIDGLSDLSSCPLSYEKVVALPVSEWIDMRNQVAQKGAFKKFFRYRKIKKKMRLAGLNKPADLSVLESYSKLIDIICKAQRECIHKNIVQAEKLVDSAVKQEKLYSVFQGEGVFDLWSSTEEQIQKYYKYGLSVHKCVTTGARQLSEPGDFMATVRKNVIDEREFLDGSRLVEQAEKLIDQHDRMKDSLTHFRSLAGESDIDSKGLRSLASMLKEVIASAPNLKAWCDWIESGNRAKAMGLDALVRGLEHGLISEKETEEHLQTALCCWLAPLLIDASDVLRTFSAGKHDDLIQQFRKLDAELANTTGQFIAAKLAAGMPETSGPNAPHEYGALSRELQRQRGHKPVRQLVHELGECLLDLTPCFMMSPLSVAQYLPSEYQAFDLVVFDEASQITVWDAVGSVARGKNVIVVGDPQQMPPTSFFNRTPDDGDSDEADLESILDQAMAARVAYHRLTGHYRSRHESLITFSNHQYYQNSLSTYPCADIRDSAVIWHRVDGLYSKGTARNNPIEARAVVNEVIRRLNDPILRKQSIGIVTFNSEQQQLIENLLDDARRENTALERFFKEDGNEPVFVKNLETVQGDQRDVICLSIGYGPTEPEAQTMSMNFGPLNRQGGERRLNVAITRAASEMLVFSSFDASMIDLSRTSAQAVKDLKAYIDYAARGPIALAQRPKIVDGSDKFDSEFEEAVAILLREKGWQLRTQIGVSKFRIDLGILDPDAGGAFLAGIECDGASYHSSPSARDRDRVRHIILENLGWTLIRVWSTDFFNNQKKVIDQVNAKLKKLLEEKRERKTPADKEKMISPGEFSGIENLDNSDEVKEKRQSQIPPCASSPQVSDKPLLIETYECFKGNGMVDPRHASSKIVAEGLLDIVQIEGPMLVKRAYDIYLRGCGIKRMGKDLRIMMNQALNYAFNNGGLIKEDEWSCGDLINTFIRSPDHKTVRLRMQGGRNIDEIPPSEIRAASEFILASTPELIHESEEHLRKILEFYALTRLTKHTREKLSLALENFNKT